MAIASRQRFSSSSTLSIREILAEAKYPILPHPSRRSNIAPPDFFFHFQKLNMSSKDNVLYIGHDKNEKHNKSTRHSRSLLKKKKINFCPEKRN